MSKRGPAFERGLSPEEARTDREFRGRLAESAVGAHLANAAGDGISLEEFLTRPVQYWLQA